MVKVLDYIVYSDDKIVYSDENILLLNRNRFGNDRFWN